MTGHHHPWRLQHLAIRVALIASLCGPGQPAAAGSDDPAIVRVRSEDPALAALIERAAGQSATFQRLFASIQRSNGIVHVEAGKCGRGVRGCLKIWMNTVGPNRYLRIVIDSSKIKSDVKKIGLIGHELQHAVEALSEPGVTDGVLLYNFFKRSARTVNDTFETYAAVDAGDDIQGELRRH